ncbi:MAG: ISAs1 family transposase, partial [Proteobacteria bacterium]|nr:ISAs1 family transposase [Pseudomonadota bacterium]
YLLAVKANQPTLQAEIEGCFAVAEPGSLDIHVDHNKGHGRIEQRSVRVVREVDWLNGERRFPGELRLPDAASSVRVKACIQRGEKRHEETRCYISSAILTAE